MTKSISLSDNTLIPSINMGNGKKFPPILPEKDDYIVTYDGTNDPFHPHNLPLAKKLIYTGVIGLSAFSISMGSAMFASASVEVEKEYHIGPTVGALGTSLFVFGFASGPVIWGPLSELFGRKIVLVASSFTYICFCFATGTAKDIQTIMICRFFLGFVGAAPLVVAPASMADLFNAESRGKALTIFIVVLFSGPMFAPIVSAFIVKNPNMGWRWTQYISGIIGGVSCLLIMFVYKETHNPTVLVKKAKVLREKTGNWVIRAPQEDVSLDIRNIVQNNIARPLSMLFTEPILFLITLYNAFLYGMMYLFLTAIPLIFSGKYQIQDGVAELPYLSIFIGILIGAVICVIFEKRFNDIKKKTGKTPPPEQRLWPMLLGSVFFAGGIFWLGWSGDFPNRIHWIVPTIGNAFIGMGLMTLFGPSFNYIIDCYLFYAASALAGNTFLRSAFGAAFPLFARQVFVNLGIKWAATLLGGLSALMIPVPYLFYIYGESLRKKSKFAFE